MKNKALKILGIGALCCVGAMTFAGCANVTDAQISDWSQIAQNVNDKINNLEQSNNSILDKVGELNQSNNSISDKVDSMDQSNSSILDKVNELDESNSSILDKVNSLDQSNSSILDKVEDLNQTTDEIKDVLDVLEQDLVDKKAQQLYKQLDYYLISNRVELMKNCKITMSMAGQVMQEMFYYEMSDGTKILVVNMNSQPATVVYQEQGADAYECSNQGSNWQKVKLTNFDCGCAKFGFFYQALSVMSRFGLPTQGDYIYATINDDDNYEISTLYTEVNTQQEESFSMMTVLATWEVTTEGKALAVNFQTTQETDENVNVVSMDLTFDYDVVTDEDVQSVLQTVKAVEVN